MSAKRLDVPTSDIHFLRSIASAIVKVLLRPSSLKDRISLLRLLFALQRLPFLAEGMNLSLSIGNYLLAFEDDGLTFSRFTEDWHTSFHARYMVGANFVRDPLADLDGVLRTNALMFHASDFLDLVAERASFEIEDYSAGNLEDQVPMKVNPETPERYQ